MLAAFAVAALVWRDFTESRGPSAASLIGELPDLPAQVGAQSRSWRWTQTVGDSTRIEVRADDFVQGAEGRWTDLRGVVLKIFREESGRHDRVESAAMRMLEGGDLFSEGETVIRLGIAEDGSDRPVVATTSGVTFRPAASSARTERPVRYEFDGGRGRSVGAVYDAGSGELRMLSDVRIERSGDGVQGPPSTVRSGGLRYSERAARIELTGGVSLRQGARWMECRDGTLWLVDGRVDRIEGAEVRGGEPVAGGETSFSTPSMQARFGPEGELRRVEGRGPTVFGMARAAQSVSIRGRRVTLDYDGAGTEGGGLLRRVEAEGAAEARTDAMSDGLRNALWSEHLLLTLHPASGVIERVETLQRGRLEQVALGPPATSRELRADRIQLEYTEGSLLERLAAAGNAAMALGDGSGGGALLRTWSDELRGTFEPGSSAMSGIRQEGSFRFEESSADGEHSKAGAADEAAFDLTTGALTLAGRASVSDGGSAVSARSIVLDRATGRLEADGAVSSSVLPGSAGAEGAMPDGLFEGREPIFATADSLVSDPQRNALEYLGGARLWQGTNRIDADAILLDPEASTLRARSGVGAYWIEGKSGAADASAAVSVQAGEMAYDGASGEAVFRGAVDFRRGGVRTLADELRTVMGGAGPEGTGTAVARGSVRIAQFADGSGIRAFGSRAEFRIAESEVSLSGSPARILRPDGTDARGDLLTFSMGGDHLHVTGRGPERAYTYHPSAR